MAIDLRFPRSAQCRPLLPLFLLVALGQVACSGALSSNTVATTVDSSIDASEIRALLASLPESTRTSLRNDKAALERFVRSELVRRELVKEAKTGKIDSDPGVAEQLARVRDDALMRLWVAKQAAVSDSYPSEEDLKLAYQSNVAALTPPAQYRVAQIFVAAPNGIAPAQLATAMRKAAEVGQRIPGGDFSALAREYSEHAASAASGGDVGLLSSNQMLPEVVAAVRNLEVGATAGPIKTSQGLHYVKLLERKVESTLTFEQARDQLKAALRVRRAQELEQAYLAALDAKLNVTVDEIALAQLVPPVADEKATK